MRRARTTHLAKLPYDADSWHADHPGPAGERGDQSRQLHHPTGHDPWDDVLPHQVPFTKDVFDNLLWWTNATKAAREQDVAAAAKAA